MGGILGHNGGSLGTMYRRLGEILPILATIELSSQLYVFRDCHSY